VLPFTTIAFNFFEPMTAPRPPRPHALANNESVECKLGDKILKKIAVEITEKLLKSTTVDWQVRNSVRAAHTQAETLDELQENLKEVLDCA